MKVRLATYSVGTDSNGTEAIGFGFEPQEGGASIILMKTRHSTDFEEGVQV